MHRFPKFTLLYYITSLIAKIISLIEFLLLYFFFLFIIINKINMDSRVISFAILLLLAGIFHIATTSIGIQCSNESSGYKEKHPSHTGFLISQLVCAILITIIGIVWIYLATKST
jgi:hypothetical protein